MIRAGEKPEGLSDSDERKGVQATTSSKPEFARRGPEPRVFSFSVVVQNATGGNYARENPHVKEGPYHL